MQRNVQHKTKILLWITIYYRYSFMIVIITQLSILIETWKLPQLYPIYVRVS